jgi:hypothetical protein
MQSLLTSPLAKFGDYHGSSWIPLGRFQYQGISRDGSQGYSPERNHTEEGFLEKAYR